MTADWKTLRILRITLRFFVALSLPAVWGLATAGPIVNGGFETGDFTDWTTFTSTGAYAAVVDSRYPGAPIRGDYSALLVGLSHLQLNPNPPNPPGLDTCAGDPWSIYCPNPTPFPNFPSGGPSLSFPPNQVIGQCIGPCIGQDFDAIAGDVVALDWQFLTNEIGYVDNAFIEFTNGATTLLTRFAAAGNTYPPVPPLQPAPSGSGFAIESSLFTSLTSIPVSGRWTMLIGVEQFPDLEISSGILVDNVRQLREIPEPSTLSLVALLLSVAATLSLRRRARGGV